MPIHDEGPELNAATPDAPAPAGEKSPTSIYLVSYPKIVFLYPSFFVALGAGIWTLLSGGTPDDDPGVAALVFLGVLGMNLVVLSFDFPRATSLTLFFCAAALVLGAWVSSLLYPDLLPAVGTFLSRLRPYADAQFYFVFAGILGAIYIAVWATVHLDYWEVRPNELLHHHGVLSDLERFAAPNLRIDKEINDVFEYLLLRSGRLILHPSQEPRAIVLENVFFINRKERELTQMLGALQVRVRKDG
ncbi:MAG TPA: hypothetical protein VML55_01460 [Planctomycetaceae bacterium]|nr:hypothetical protein [Planctomycetaceae bacterium]